MRVLVAAALLAMIVPSRAHACEPAVRRSVEWIGGGGEVRNSHFWLREDGEHLRGLGIALRDKDGTPVAIEERIEVLSSGSRLHEVIPKEPLVAKATYKLGYATTTGRVAHTFQAGNAVDDDAPRWNATTLTLVTVPADACEPKDQTHVVIPGPEDAHPPPAAFWLYLAWLPDQHGVIHIDDPPDVAEALNANFAVGRDRGVGAMAVQLIDAAGHRSERRELQLPGRKVATPFESTMRRAQRKISRWIGENPAPTAIALVVLFFLAYFAVKLRRAIR